MEKIWASAPGSQSEESEFARSVESVNDGDGALLRAKKGADHLSVSPRM